MGNKIGRKVSKQNVQLIKVNKIKSIKKVKKSTNQGDDPTVEDKLNKRVISTNEKENEIQDEARKNGDVKKREVVAYLVNDDSEKYAIWFSESILVDVFETLRELIKAKMFILKNPVTETELKNKVEKFEESKTIGEVGKDNIRHTMLKHSAESYATVLSRNIYSETIEYFRTRTKWMIYKLVFIGYKKKQKK